MTQQKLKLLPILDLLGEGEALKRAAGSNFVEKWANVSNFRDLQHFVWRLADLNYGVDCEATQMADDMRAASRGLGVPLTLAHFQVPGYAERAQRVLAECAVKRNCAIPATCDDDVVIYYTPTATVTNTPPQRPETGPMQFGDDWPGYFLRGDYAIYLGMILESAQSDPRFDALLRNLARDLQGAEIESGVPLQKLRPFVQCLETK